MPHASAGPPAVGSPRMPFPPPPALATLTGVVVFSQPDRAAAPPAVRASPPARASSARRERPLEPEPEASFKVGRSLRAPTLPVKAPSALNARSACRGQGMPDPLAYASAALVAEHALRRVVARRGDHAAARVRSGAAQIEPVHGGGVAGREWGRAHERHLVEALLALEDRAADEP